MAALARASRIAPPSNASMTRWGCRHPSPTGLPLLTGLGPTRRPRSPAARDRIELPSLQHHLFQRAQQGFRLGCIPVIGLSHQNCHMVGGEQQRHRRVSGPCRSPGAAVGPRRASMHRLPRSGKWTAIPVGVPPRQACGSRRRPGAADRVRCRHDAGHLHGRCRGRTDQSTRLRAPVPGGTPRRAVS